MKQNLVEKESSMAWHPTPVIHNRWDVAGEKGREKNVSSQIYSEYCLHLGQDSLSISFQLADLKENHQVVFGVTRSRCGASHRV